MLFEYVFIQVFLENNCIIFETSPTKNNTRLLVQICTRPTQSKKKLKKLKMAHVQTQILFITDDLRDRKLYLLEALASSKLQHVINLF